MPWWEGLKLRLRVRDLLLAVLMRLFLVVVVGGLLD